MLMMRKTIVFGSVSLVLVIAVALAGCGQSDQGTAQAGTQTTCPVMGNKIDKRYYVDYQGRRVYFCCPDCPGKFKADPEKYLKKMADQGVVLEEAS